MDYIHRHQIGGTRAGGESMFTRNAERRTGRLIAGLAVAASLPLMTACGHDTPPGAASSPADTSASPASPTATSPSATPGPAAASSDTSSPNGSINPLPPATLPDGYVAIAQDEQFVNQAAAQWETDVAGGTPVPSQEDLIAIGHSVCSAWHSGNSVSETKTPLMNVPQIGPHNGTELIVGAAQYLCPQDYPPDGM
jgi:hypothetical protein